MTDISKEYAEALFSLAYESGRVKEYGESLFEIQKAINENPEYISLVSSPAIPLSERLALIDAAFSENMPEYTVSFLKLLCENRRFEMLPSVIEDFHALARMAENRVDAQIYYAGALDGSQKAALEDKLEKILGKAVDA